MEVTPPPPSRAKGTRQDTSLLASMMDQALRLMQQATEEMKETTAVQIRQIQETTNQAQASLSTSLELNSREITEGWSSLQERQEQFLERQEHIAAVTEALMEETRTTMESARTEVQTLLARLQTFSSEAERKIAQSETDARDAIQQTRIQAEQSSRVMVRQARLMQSRLWLGAATVSILVSISTIGMLTASRPGWTLTHQQHKAMGIGEDAIREYQKADSATRARMREIMHWKE